MSTVFVAPAAVSRTRRSDGARASFINFSPQELYEALPTAMAVTPFCYLFDVPTALTPEPLVMPRVFPIQLGSKSALRQADQLLQAIQFVRSRGVVHRVVKAGCNAFSNQTSVVS